jgi:riboflavin synthase alpha subunit
VKEMTRKEFRVETAKKRRRCINCGDSIYKDDACLTFRYGSSSYSVSANICRVCILDNLEKMYQLTRKPLEVK